MKAGLWDAVSEAFKARPAGMFVPPNYVMLGLFGFLGLLNPGFWVIGAGLELAYLGMLASNERFQRFVQGRKQWEARRLWQAKIEGQVNQLAQDSMKRYRALEVRCRSILQHQARGGDSVPGLEEQGEGLGRLLWVYLRLLQTRQAIERMIRESAEGGEDVEGLEERIRNLRSRLEAENLSDDIRKSLGGQIEILEQRVVKRHEARQKLSFLDAELTRIQEQVELVREQAVLSTDPQAVSQRIDQITTTLGGTSNWISEQQKLYGAVEDLLAEPPALSPTVPMRESQ